MKRTIGWYVWRVEIAIDNLTLKRKRCKNCANRTKTTGECVQFGITTKDENNCILFRKQNREKK